LLLEGVVRAFFGGFIFGVEMSISHVGVVELLALPQQFGVNEELADSELVSELGLHHLLLLWRESRHLVLVVNQFLVKHKFLLSKLRAEHFFLSLGD
jgi:hypothetical protein